MFTSLASVGSLDLGWAQADETQLEEWVGSEGDAGSPAFQGSAASDGGVSSAELIHTHVRIASILLELLPDAEDLASRIERVGSCASA